MPVTQSYEATDVNHVLTLEEITNLTEEGGKPADTLMNVVALIATRFRTDVCSAICLSRIDRTSSWQQPLASTRDALAPCACRSTRASSAWSRNK
jgi:hypothetical protein